MELSEIQCELSNVSDGIKFYMPHLKLSHNSGMTIVHPGSMLNWSILSIVM